MLIFGPAVKLEVNFPQQWKYETPMSSYWHTSGPAFCLSFLLLHSFRLIGLGHLCLIIWRCVGNESHIMPPLARDQCSEFMFSEL